MRLVKALYGARQASRRFQEHLHKVLSTTMGMTRCKSDPCVWNLDVRTNAIHVKGLTNEQTNGLHIKLAAHVDDFLITTNSKTTFFPWMQVLGKQLTIKYDELTERPQDCMSLTMVYDRKKRF